MWECQRRDFFSYFFSFLPLYIHHQLSLLLLLWQCNVSAIACGLAKNTCSAEGSLTCDDLRQQLKKGPHVFHKWYSIMYIVLEYILNSLGKTRRGWRKTLHAPRSYDMVNYKFPVPLRALNKVLLWLDHVPNNMFTLFWDQFSLPVETTFSHMVDNNLFRPPSNV